MTENEELKCTKCHGCAYEDTCAGIRDGQVRRMCVARRQLSHVQQPERWTEMSYYKYAYKSMAERIRTEIPKEEK